MVTTTPTAPVLTLPAAHGGCPFDPPPAYDRAARQGSVTPAELADGTSCWLVTGYQEVRTVLSDPRFSADARHPAFPFLTPGRRALATANPSFIRLDDPEHARLRRMVTKDFLVHRIDAMRPGIQRIVDEAVDRMTARGTSADLVADFALPVPSLVICLLLGVPYEDHEMFQARSRTLLDNRTTPAEAGEAQHALTGYLTDLAAHRRRHPADDMLSRLAARTDLSLAETAATGLLLLVAGHETTANMTALSTLALLRRPAQADRLRADPGLVRGAVEELLRYLTIVQSGLPRVTTEDVELGGTPIGAGEGVIALLSTANRDEELFGAGAELDVTRDARRHLAFGFGVHQCLGQPLARAELQIALETLLRRLPGLRVTVPEDELVFRGDSVVYGLDALPVAW
ncbi:cytochrome P450 [Kitasatospora sp. NPDC057015]|uniref:cytochrome P450 n=1 Tax=Kitasatospora sp. NPDC057015 TaxID=3346001 RepID=UPI0036404E57